MSDALIFFGGMGLGGLVGFVAGGLVVLRGFERERSIHVDIEAQDAADRGQR